MIDHGEIARFYDRIGRVEDWWSVFGDRAVGSLLDRGAFDSARAICELGCGTGRLAERILQDHASADCRYVGVDISRTMTERAQRRLAPWRGRATVIRADAVPRLPFADGVFDRFVATYVVEVFDPPEARALMADAHRVLAPGGLACLTALGKARTPASRLVCGVWERLHRWRPALTGGCRPVGLRDYLPETDWTVRHESATVRFGVPCETVVAERR